MWFKAIKWLGVVCHVFAAVLFVIAGNWLALVWVGAASLWMFSAYRWESESRHWQSSSFQWRALARKDKP